MKRLLALVLLLALVGVASATSLNFQNPGDFSQTVYQGHGSSGLNPSKNISEWYETLNGRRNSFKAGLYVDGASDYKFSGRMLPYPYATTYSAATIINSNPVSMSGPMIILYGSSKNILYTYNPSTTYSPYRYEVRIVGGTAKIYRNGTNIATSGALATNPYFVAYGVGSQIGYNPAGNWGLTYWTDYVYGDTEEKLVLSLPESDGDAFIMLDDFVNDAADGLYNTTSGTQVDANNMYGYWSDGNSSIGTPLENKTIYLKHYDSGTIYWTGYTRGEYIGTFTIPIKTNVIDAGGPDGYYILVSDDGAAMSNMILKRSQGATITFDKDDYSVDDKATVAWEVQTGDYWDTSLYSYRVLIRDLYGVEKTSYAVTERVGSFEYVFSSSDDPGVYIAVITATPRSGGNALYIGTDYATLSEYGVITGYVTDHQGIGISGANVTFDQGSYTSVLTSGVDGNFTSLPFFITGTELLCNITASGYRQHYYTILPRSTKTKNINFTLPVDPMSFTGLGIDGVAMEGYLTPGTINIVNGYGNPIPFATVNVTNSTTMESYTKLATVAGYYICDVGATCDLVFDQTYEVEGSKVGYQNSSIYLKKPFGVLT
jgi:hypothetical protein